MPQSSAKKATPASAVEGFTLTDNSTGQSWNLPARTGAMGNRLIDIKRLYGDTGILTYDPGFTSTASCQSDITYIDGEKGVLLHRGYSIGPVGAALGFYGNQLSAVIRRIAHAGAIR